MSRRRDDVSPLDASPFHGVVETIHAEGRPAGWAEARDILLNEFPKFQAQMGGAYQALKAAIEVDRHAMFADVAAEKDKGRYEADTWDKFQSYLQGEIEEVPTVKDGVQERRAAVASVDRPDVTDDDEGESDDEG